MSWQTVSILVPDELVKEAIVGEFSGDGIAGVWERTHESGQSEVVFYFGTGNVPPLVEPRIHRIFERNGYPVPRVTVDEEENVDWTIEWRKGFTSFPLGERFRVVPGWEEPPLSDTRIALRIDPGMAFGTGTHETTRTVVEVLEHLNVRLPVLDLGTGAGILTAAASKLGARFPIACDVDSDAVFVARDNLRRNQVRAGVFVGSVDAVRDASIGLVLANLNIDAIVRNLGEIARVLQPSGQAVFSGVLASQSDTLEARIREVGLVVKKRIQCAEWVSFLVNSGGG